MEDSEKYSQLLRELKGVQGRILGKKKKIFFLTKKKSFCGSKKNCKKFKLAIIESWIFSDFHSWG